MKKLVTLGLIAISFLASTQSSNAQVKIGYISADEVIVLMPEAARIDTQLNQFQQALYQTAQEQNAELNDAVAKFYKDSATMSPQLKEVKRKDLQTKIQEMSGAEQRIQAQFEQKRQELSMPLQKKLQAAIQEVAKENGYTYILPRESLIVMPPGDDIGRLVRKKLGIKESAERPAPVRPTIKK